MLRNKVGLKKMISDNGLVSLIPSVEVGIPAVPVNMGFKESGKSRRRSRDPKRRDERIFHNPTHTPGQAICV